MDAAPHGRAPARVALSDYTDAILAGVDRRRPHTGDPPRNFRSLGREEQQRVLNQRPPRTGTRWDALLAATVEHPCELKRDGVTLQLLWEEFSAAIWTATANTQFCEHTGKLRDGLELPPALPIRG